MIQTEKLDYCIALNPFEMVHHNQVDKEKTLAMSGVRRKLLG